MAVCYETGYKFPTIQNSGEATTQAAATLLSIEAQASQFSGMVLYVAEDEDNPTDTDASMYEA